MNYYIKGNAAKAEQIRAAFEVNGIDTSANSNYGISNLFYFSCNGEVAVTQNRSIINIIKTHPDYQELELPIEPKFKVGDWIVKKNGNTFYGGNYAEQITLVEVDEKGKYIWLPSKTWVDEDYIRLWTIADARDGDVITNGKLIVIFNKLEEPAYKQHIIAYVGLDLCGKLQITEDTWQLGIDKAMPATKEQRDLLFKKMREAGYEWDAEKKELKKIQHYDIKNFRPFDKVLVRCSNDEEWMIEFYCKYDTLVHTSPHRDYPFMGIGDSYSQCIPFEGNEHLLGTTDMPSEEYINW